MNDKVINSKVITSSIGSKIELNNDIKFYSIFPSIDFPIKIELFCPECNEKRIFKCDSYSANGYPMDNSRIIDDVIYKNKERNLLIYRFSCEFNHEFKIILETDGYGNLYKIGQSPDPLYYSEKVNNDIIKELNSEEKKYYYYALKAYENDLNIASFVYLRRIFEHLIKKAKSQSSTDFQKITRTGDIVKQLVKENLLNPMLIDTGYSVLYQQISDGVHNLNEQECREQFELMKNAIEIILEDEIYHKRLENRKKATAKLLNDENSKTET